MKPLLHPRILCDQFSLRSLTPLLQSKPPSRPLTFGTPSPGTNRIYDPIRSSTALTPLLTLTSTLSTPLLALFTTSICPTCPHALSLIHSLLIHDRVGESQGGIAFAEIEIDSPTIGDLPMRYMISSVPTLMAFDREEPRLGSALSGRDVLHREVVRAWIEGQGRREKDKGWGFGNWFGGG